jgi:hypothetical protein
MGRCLRFDLVGPAPGKAPGEVPDFLPFWEFDLLLFEWPRIAAMAWDGYLAQGEGFVQIDVEEEEPRFSYRLGAPCDCHRELVDAYDPEFEVVVRIVYADRDHLHRLSGRPGPAETFRCVGAAMVDAPVH